MANFLRTLPTDYPLYGSHEVAPLLALLSDRRLFGNYIDTNPQVFASGRYDRERISREAVAEGVILAARITSRPELGIEEAGYESFFSPELFRNYCRRLKFFPSGSREGDNYLGLYFCSRSRSLGAGS
jgi:hypothetical protein